MNFLIDGAYGELYRAAMFCPQRHKSGGEWDIERRMAEQNVAPRPAPARLGLVARFIAMINCRKAQTEARVTDGAMPTA
jgi:hypothetical protein